MSDDRLPIIEDKVGPVRPVAAPPWLLLVVDDDETVHTATRFALDGGHARAACTACHKPGRRAGEVELLFKDTARNCAGDSSTNGLTMPHCGVR